MKRLDELTERLNEALTQAAKRLRDKHLGCAARIELDEEGTLWWRKHDGQWDLFFEDRTGTLHLLIKASRTYRVMGAARLQDLYEAVLVVQSGEEERVQAAIELAESFNP
jgi:hypothetical protein